MTSRFIDLTPTWQEAAAIIAAALENGTGTGREMARAELFRMAAILDDLKTDQENGKAVDLWEVISTNADGAAFGQTFHSEQTAAAYTRTMQAKGYSADMSPAFNTQPDLKTALQNAASFYDRDELAEPAAFVVAKTDDAGQRRTFLESRTVPHWTQDSQQADRLTATDAERMADDWNSYARNKGLQATYAAIEAPEQEPQP